MITITRQKHIRRLTRTIGLLALAFFLCQPGQAQTQTNVNTGGGTINKVPKWTPTNIVMGDSVTSESSSGKIGIGTTAAAYKLQLEGNLGIGITHPQARLDLDEFIRASQGIVFPHGSIQESAATKTLAATSRLPDPLLRSVQADKSGKKSSGGQEHTLSFRYLSTKRKRWSTESVSLGRAPTALLPMLRLTAVLQLLRADPVRSPRRSGTRKTK